MSGNIMLVDARGLSCPQPVLETKKAIERTKDGDREIAVLVDTVTSRENVVRFASSAGWQASAEAEGDYYRINLVKLTKTTK